MLPNKKPNFYVLNSFSSNKEILSFLIASGGKVSEAGWINVLDDQFFGTPLVLAYWIKSKSNGLPMSEKILSTISNEHQRLHNSFHPSSK
jgi:hypothetical protein